MNKWPPTLFKKKEDPQKKKVSLRYLLMILAIGVVLMLLDSLFTSENSDPVKQDTIPVTEETAEPEQAKPAFGGKSSSPSSVIEYQNYYANELKEVLEDVTGVSDVTVKVYVDTSKTKIVSRNRSVQSQTTEETDQQGGERRIQQRSEDSEVVFINGAQGEKPLIVGTEAPGISGVVVVAEGADNAQVKLWIKEAVQGLYGVPNSRITVLPKKMKGE